MNDIPKPTPEFNRLIGEADYLMSAILLEIQTRINLFNPVADNIETFNRSPNIKNDLLKNLKYTHGSHDLIEKFEKTLLGQRFLCGGYDQNKVEVILRKYKKIVKMRNSIAHGLPHNINGKYVKIHRNTDKNKIAEDIIVDEAFLAEFIEECNDLIEIFNSPDYDSIINTTIKNLRKSIEPAVNILSQSKVPLVPPYITDMSSLQKCQINIPKMPKNIFSDSQLKILSRGFKNIFNIISHQHKQ